jgi:hypothetical protein
MYGLNPRDATIEPLLREHTPLVYPTSIVERKREEIDIVLKEKWGGEGRRTGRPTKQRDKDEILTKVFFRF